MKKYLSVIPMVCLLCFVVGCQKAEEEAEEPTVNVEADIEAARNWVKGNFAAADTGDLEGYLSFWTEDVIWMPPNAPIIRGKSAVRGYVQPFFEQLNMLHEYSIEEVEVEGDFAFTRISSKETYTPKTGEGEPMIVNSKAIFMLKRTPDGTWLCTHGIWNSNDPLPASE